MSFVLFYSFKQSLLASFDQQLKARAAVVIQKTNIYPRIVPLPQGEETFTLTFNSESQTDTLFTSPVIGSIDRPGMRKDKVIDSWRLVTVEQDMDNGGTLKIRYGLPSAGIQRTINTLMLRIAFILPLGIMLAFLLGYWLANKLIRPIRQVIGMANTTNLRNDTQLIGEADTSNELKELIVSFNRMLLRIREQSSRQTAFFASASHELRTPLSVMQTRLEVLMDTKDSPTRDLYEEQLKDVRSLTKMVNDFLLLSELTTGNIPVKNTDCDLSETLTACLARFSSRATGKKISFQVIVEPLEADFVTKADENMCSIIFNNLLDNALKYSPMESTVHLLMQREPGSVVLQITNVIRSDIHPDITDVKNEFYHSKPLNGEGSGLGLWICNQLAELQGIGLDLSITGTNIFCARLLFRP